MLLDQWEAIADMKRRIASREWWIIPAASQMGRDMATLIERDFYDGDKNAQFHLYMLPCVCDGVPIAAMFFAHKSVMTPAMLSKKLGKELDGSHDVLFTEDIPLAFLNWMLETFDTKTPSQN